MLSIAEGLLYLSGSNQVTKWADSETKRLCNIDLFCLDYLSVSRDNLGVLRSGTGKCANTYPAPKSNTWTRHMSDLLASYQIAILRLVEGETQNASKHLQLRRP
jgi:hypothetical protein